jgi:protein-S-isoprenylcysteine O-methyltransferase Ste14
MVKSLKSGLKNLLGVGPYLLIIGLIIESLTAIIRRFVYFPISLDIGIRILLTIPCVVACLLGMRWFNHSLNLIKINFSDGENRLITHGPFAYVRHPLYSTLMLTLPPLLIIWFADLIFFIPWILIILVSHLIVSIEERGLIEAFGKEYQRYQKYVPALIPYKGSAGKCFYKR